MLRALVCVCVCVPASRANVNLDTNIPFVLEITLVNYKNYPIFLMSMRGTSHSTRVGEIFVFRAPTITQMTY